MPRVTDAHRRARRDQIADAAVKVLRRHGITDTSIAQISAECQLSIGAIYANFENKADLARYIATRLFDWRISELEAAVKTGSIITPADMLALLLSSVAEEHRPAPSVILQFWSNASVDEDLREVLAEQVGRLCASVETALRPWADTATGGAAEGAGQAAEDLARRTAQTLMIMGQGYLANSCLFGWQSAEDYRTTAIQALSSGST